jgi:hypothetical protein
LNKLGDILDHDEFYCCCGHTTSSFGTFTTPNKEGYNILNGDTCITKNKIICKEIINSIKKPRNAIKKKIEEKIKNMRQKYIKKLFTIWKESKTYISFYLPKQLQLTAEEFAKQKFTLKHNKNEPTSKKWSVVKSVYKKYFEKVEVKPDMTSFYDLIHRKEMKFKFQLISTSIDRHYV